MQKNQTPIAGERTQNITIDGVALDDVYAPGTPEHQRVLDAADANYDREYFANPCEPRDPAGVANIVHVERE